MARGFQAVAGFGAGNALRRLAAPVVAPSIVAIAGVAAIAAIAAVAASATAAPAESASPAASAASAMPSVPAQEPVARAPETGAAPGGLEASEHGIRLREVSADWGIPFRHHHGGSGRRFMVETQVGGLVIFDFDLDGDEDVLMVNGGALPGYEGETPLTRLYRNDGGGPRFIDFTERSGIDFGTESSNGNGGYGSGAGAADWDGDGDVDLYITGFGRDAVYENLGDGSFAAADGTGLANDLWGSAAAFADVDRDGDLDLYVANYVDFGFDNHKLCGNPDLEIRAYCAPGQFNGLADVFYLNDGDGTFTDATAAAGFSDAVEAGLGAVFGDLDLDGWPDLYVANDTDPNFLFRNLGGGKFGDDSLLSGTSHGDRGDPEAGMGVDFGDIDQDGLLDIVVTNFELETNALYKNMGGLLFTDGRFVANTAEPTLNMLAFGVDFADLDNDGDLDLVVANGHVLDNAPQMNSVGPYKQVNQVFENLGAGRFRLLDGVFEIERVSRGLGTGDLDGDGDLDLVINNSNDRAEVYENLTGNANRLAVDLRSESANRFGIGARVTLEIGGVRWPEEVRTSSSYMSQNALTLHFGLGQRRAADGLSVTWPTGKRQRFVAPRAGRYLLFEGLSRP